ncbi:type I-F CRISPR-associated protein Cas7f/Csy3 [Grimontia hollisae]|uniref:type I-F CRISPR-associated protein Cas7f/Csy3 n=1 Tax=Grimontia hollisae TaxID=673 RepID=UPI0023DA0221|nr:type I-F CRISPR-associated protein Cas7f/Csy3 [Grimontia hollisae]MDF2185666.1 type I-F CRISPR-associated protein Cas7f/Csy3 [Grimontia hollisae]
MEIGHHLKYQGSLTPGKAIFSGEDDNRNHYPIPIARSERRTTGKNGFSDLYMDNFTPKNVELADLVSANIVTRDECTVPLGIKWVNVSFNLRIHPNSLKPLECHHPESFETLRQFAKYYQALGGYQVLAEHYAKNILMGTWLYRNKESAKSIKLTAYDDETVLFSVNNIEELDWHTGWEQRSAKTLVTDAADYEDRELSPAEALTYLTTIIADALTDKRKPNNLDFAASIKVSAGEQLFPSQAFTESNSSANGKRKVSENNRVLDTSLSADGKHHTASLHTQKVGAALAMIDHWWNDDACDLIRVSEYGRDRQRGTLRRHPKGEARDAYALFKDLESLVEEMREQKVLTPDMHFLMAILIKGGPFIKKSED